MRKILISLCAATVLSATSNDPQSILTEVSKLRQMYDECKATQATVGGVGPKTVVESSSKNKSLNQEISQKNGVIKSLEQTLLSRDRAYREATAQNKNLISQLHTQKVSVQERETLKRAVETAKAELLVAQKALKQAGGVKTVYKDRSVVQEKIVTKTVESNEKINKLQRDLATAQTTIANLQNTALKTVGKDKIIEKVVYRDRPVAYEKIVEKIVYRDRPISKDKAVEKVVYKDRPVVKEKIVEKIVYKDRPIVREKIVEKVVYKDRLVVKEKIVEKTVHKELKVPKNSPKTVLKAEAIKQEPVKKQVIDRKVMDEQKRRQADKLALEQERKKSAKVASIPTTKRAAPSAYRMATIASIYNAPNGTKVDMWEAGRSFTSGTSNGGWVKITGYFVNRVWQSADEDYWVKESDVIRR
ncbi:MAG: IMCp domain-containing protein [Pseudomonadota bacterium]